MQRFSFSIGWVIKTLLPQTTGVELPRSGKGARQRTFWFVLHWRGSSVSLEMPVPSGPRQPGQGPAQAVQFRPTQHAIEAATILKIPSFVSGRWMSKRQIRQRGSRSLARMFSLLDDGLVKCPDDQPFSFPSVQHLASNHRRV